MSSPQGLTLEHIRTKEVLHLDAPTVGIYVLHTVADYAEQVVGHLSTS